MKEDEVVQARVVEDTEETNDPVIVPDQQIEGGHDKPDVEAVPTSALTENVISPAEVNPEMLLAKAIEKGDVGQLERLMALRRELKAEYAKQQFFKALGIFQSKCPPIIKTKEVRGERIHYKYAPLDKIVAATKDLERECGFSHTIDVLPRTNNDEPITAVLVLHHVDGHETQTRFTSPIDDNKFMSRAQRVSTAATYAKRNVFCNAFGIVTADQDTDDARRGDPRSGIKIEGEDELEAERKPEKWSIERRQSENERNPGYAAYRRILVSAVRDNLFTVEEADKWQQRADEAARDQAQLVNLQKVLTKTLDGIREKKRARQGSEESPGTTDEG